MVITAKFSSTCPNCQRRIEAGESVEWNRGEKARHTACQPAAAASQPARVSVEDAGVYVMPDGAIAKVQANREKTRTYAKLWVSITGRRLTLAGTVERGEYRYEPGLVEQVAADGRKMTLAEAKQFIIMYGQCARCSRSLKDAKSVERGIGPVCIKYFSAGATALDAMGVSDDATHARIIAAADAEFNGFFGVPQPPARVSPFAPVLYDDTAAIQQSERAEAERVARFKMERDDLIINRRSRWSRAGDDELEHAAW